MAVAPSHARVNPRADFAAFYSPFTVAELQLAH
jgi:hypothetical protein